MTVEHLILTRRSEPMSRWLEAFPDARVAVPESKGARAGAGLVWLHLDPADPNVASQTRSAVELAKGAPVVVLANVPGQDEGIACLEAGAVGYISALSVPEVLRQVVNVVRNGGLWVGPELLARLRKALAAPPKATAASDKLTLLSQREREVALAVAAGASNKEIARRMGITERTVKAHLTTIFGRLNVRDRLQLSILVNGESPNLKHAVH